MVHTYIVTNTTIVVFVMYHLTCSWNYWMFGFMWGCT